MRAAIIHNGTVENIIVITDGYGGAIPTGDLPVAIGDTYDGADFWKNGEKVTLPQPEGPEEGAGIPTGEETGE